MPKKSVAYIHDFCFLNSEEKNEHYTAVGMPQRYFDRFFESGFSNVNIYSRNKSKKENEIYSMGFSKIENRSINVPISISNYFFLLNPFFVIKYYKSLSNASLLVINFPSIIGVYTWFLNLLLGKPYTLEIAADENQFRQKMFGSLLTKIFRFLFPKVINRSKGGIYVSKYLLNKYPHVNGVVASNVIINNVNKTPCNFENFENGKIVNILFVGGVNKRKGINTLIKSIENIRNKGFINVKLNIVGGHFDADYKSLVMNNDLTDYVNFLGILTPQAVSRQMEMADIYIQPSLAEGIPRATLEAMSFNIPVIATTLPGFKEILDERYLFEPGDDSALSDLIELFINSDLIRYESALQNNKTILNFEFNRLQNKRVDFYKNILGEINERI